MIDPFPLLPLLSVTSPLSAYNTRMRNSPKLCAVRLQNSKLRILCLRELFARQQGYSVPDSGALFNCFRGSDQAFSRDHA